MVAIPKPAFANVMRSAKTKVRNRGIDFPGLSATRVTSSTDLDIDLFPLNVKMEKKSTLT
jgi:hypothetical protein